MFILQCAEYTKQKVYMGVFKETLSNQTYKGLFVIKTYYWQNAPPFRTTVVRKEGIKLEPYL